MGDHQVILQVMAFLTLELIAKGGDICNKAHLYRGESLNNTTGKEGKC